jgi:hypothetical protein
MVRSVLLALLLWSMAVTGQNQPDPCATPPTQTGDVSLQLFLKDGQTVFRQGEIIVLTAEYSSSAGVVDWIKRVEINPETRGQARCELPFMSGIFLVGVIMELASRLPSERASGRG